MSLFLNVLGILGAALIVGSYLLLNIGKMQADTYRYLIINSIGATGVLLSMIYDFNLAAFIIELFWLIVSLLGLYRLSHLK
ncbi:hypothetical protein EYS14_09155 [Alteromonadaceae bacterium M269]|nr:hypothetical protein EYS14_09155 [Alteromonadaceae bacterium M269]